MKYFVTADSHGFFSLMHNTLLEKGFDEDNPNHKLIVCGNLMDRGKEARKMQEYILSLLEKDKAILVRGNHEDLGRWSPKSLMNVQFVPPLPLWKRGRAGLMHRS